MSDFMNLDQYLQDLAKQIKKRDLEKGETEADKKEDDAFVDSFLEATGKIVKGIDPRTDQPYSTEGDRIFALLDSIGQEASKNTTPSSHDEFVVPSPVCGGELNDANWINWFVVKKKGMTKDSFWNDGEAFKKQYGPWSDHLKYEAAWTAYMTNLGYVVEGPMMLGWSGAE